MTRRLLGLLVVAMLVLAGQAAIAGEHEDHHEFPEHPHLLVLDPVVDFSGEFPVVTSVRKCVDLAANNKLPLRSQHHNVHFGTAGEQLFDKAGHGVVPAAPFPDVPWSNCEEFLAFYGLD